MSTDESRVGFRADFSTSLTLLREVRDLSKDDAWRRFLAKYQPLVVSWCRQRGLNTADAQEVTWAIVERLVRDISRFKCDGKGRKGSFRAWLKIRVKWSISEFFKTVSKPGLRGTGGSVAFARLAEIAADGSSLDDLTSSLSDGLQRDVSPVEQACESVERRVEPQVWEAFWLTTIEELKGAEVAARLGIKVASVYQYRKRVRDMLRQELDSTE